MCWPPFDRVGLAPDVGRCASERVHHAGSSYVEGTCRLDRSGAVTTKSEASRDGQLNDARQARRRKAGEKGLTLVRLWHRRRLVEAVDVSSDLILGEEGDGRDNAHGDRPREGRVLVELVLLRARERAEEGSEGGRRWSASACPEGGLDRRRGRKQNVLSRGTGSC